MQRCNLCGSTEFKSHAHHAGAVCIACFSLPRTRLLWEYIKKFGNINEESRVMYFAPEKGIFNKLSSILKKENYKVYDISPDSYKFAKNYINRFDISQDIEMIRSDYFDAIIHSHVLEHIPCNLTYIIYHMHRALKSRGKHILILPFLPGNYDECFENLERSESERRFGQFNHVRKFGKNDIDKYLTPILNLPKSFNAIDFIPENTLMEIGLDKKLWRGLNASSVLCLNKEDMKLLCT